jgi:catechol 2,3-dioxygenase-like lactoylglutathione lyase family enzyme
MSTNTTVVPQSFYAVTLGVDDVASQRAFYEQWGWQAKPYSTAEYVAFDLQGTIVAFVEKGLLGSEAAPGEAIAEGGWKGLALAVNLPQREDVDAIWKAAVAAGARSVAEPEDRPWGGRSGYIADPEGIRWDIAWVSAELLNA